jgi:DNA-binding MarR family transcriptional regulator
LQQTPKRESILPSSAQRLKHKQVDMTKLVLDTYLPYRLSVASNKVSGLIAKAYETRFGLTIPQWRILVILSDGLALSQKGLIERTAMDKVTISRAVAALAERGLLLRESSAPDRRIDVLTLSPEGRDIVTEVAPVALEFEASLINTIGYERAADLTDMLRKLEIHAELLSTSTNL